MQRVENWINFNGFLLFTFVYILFESEILSRFSSTIVVFDNWVTICVSLNQLKLQTTNDFGQVKRC